MVDHALMLNPEEGSDPSLGSQRSVGRDIVSLEPSPEWRVAEVAVLG